MKQSWSNTELTKSILNEIVIYGKIYLTYLSQESLLSFFNLNLFILITIFCSLFLVLILIFYKILKQKKFNYYAILFIVFFSILIIFNLETVVGFSSLIKSGVVEQKLLGKKIFFRELFLLVSFILLSIFLIYLLFIKKLNLILSKNNNFFYSPFIFMIFFLLSWLYLSQIKIWFRVFCCNTFVCCFTVFKSINKLYKYKKLIYLFLFYLFGFDCKYIGEKYIQFERFYDFAIKKIERIDTINRNGFGVRPVNYCDSLQIEIFVGLKKIAIL